MFVAYTTVVNATKEGLTVLHSNLSIIVRGGEIFMTRCLADFGITACEVVILSYLYGHEGPRQEDISEYLMLDKGTVAKTLQKLERKGLIERLVNMEDQREKVITVTDMGLGVRDVCTNLVRLWHGIMFEGISEADIDAFVRVTGKISANVSADLDKLESLYGKQKG